MLFVIGAFTALGYTYFKNQTIKTNLDSQVAEFRSQQTVVITDEVPDATYNEIRATWLAGTRTDREQMNIDLTEKDKRNLLKGAKSLHDESLVYDEFGPQPGEIQGILLEMANH
jgi:hypothetical protein